MSNVETPVTRENLFPLDTPAIKIKNIDARVEDVTIEIIPNKVLVQGIIHKQIFFVGEDNLIHHQEENLPFSSFIEVLSAQPGMEAVVDITIEHIEAILTPTGDAIHQKVLIQVQVEVFEFNQMELLPLEEGDLYKLEEVVGDEVEQILVEKTLEMEVAGIKITEIQAEVVNIQDSIIQDKVIIQGEIHEQIFFVDGEGMGRHQATDIPFSFFLDLVGVQPGMNLQLAVTIEHIKATLTQEGEILEQEIILEFFVKVTETVQLPVAPGPGPLLRLEQVVSEGQDQFMEVGDVPLLFPAVKIREIQALVQDIATEILEDKLLIQGIIHQQIFYIDTEEIERHQGEDISFSHFIHLSGISPGMNVQITPTIEHIGQELLPENILHQKMVVSLFAKVTEPIRIQVEEGPGPLFKVLEVIGEGVKQELILPPVIIPPIPPPLALIEITIKEIRIEEIVQQEILEEIVPIEFPVIKKKTATAVVENVMVEIINDKAIISGIVKKQIQLVDTQGIVRHMEEEIPFQFLKDIPSDLDPQLLTLEPEVTIEHLEVSLIQENKALHQVIILLLKLKLVESRLLTVITDIEGPGITVTKQPVLTNELLTQVDREILLTQEVVLDPPATEILDTRGQILALRVVESLEGEFLVKGVIEKEIEYLFNESTETLVEVFDFEEVVTLPVVTPDLLVQIEEAEIINIEFQLSPDGETLIQEITIQMDVVVTEVREVEVVTNVTGVTDFSVELVQFIEPPDPKEVVTNVTF